jgi:thiol-disulfide isomerase/thioredoxin
MKSADSSRIPWWRAALVVGLFGLVAAAYAMYPILGTGSNPEPLAGPPPGPTSGPDTPQPVSRALATGPLTAFVLKPQRPAVADLAFADGAGKPLKLSDWRGRVALVNLWATWCAPCRKEMPALAGLQSKLGGPDFEVIAISVDRKGAAASGAFLDEAKATALKLYVDPSSKALGGLQAIGLPASVLVDREGREIGRLLGPADWNSSEAERLIRSAIAEAGPIATKKPL